jgi:hypothetical protein
MGQCLRERATVKYNAARAAHEDAGGFAWLPFVGRKALAGIMQGVFASRPIPVVPPGLKIRSNALRQEHSPCIVKSRARRVKCRSRPAGMLARKTAGIEAAAPLPLIRMVRTARTSRDGASLHVAKIDVPAVGALGVAAAGELRHVLF